MIENLRRKRLYECYNYPEQNTAPHALLRFYRSFAFLNKSEQQAVLFHLFIELSNLDSPEISQSPLTILRSYLSSRVFELPTKTFFRPTHDAHALQSHSFERTSTCPIYSRFETPE